MLEFAQQIAMLQKSSALILIFGGNTVTSRVGLVVHIISGAHSRVMSCDLAVHSWVKTGKPYSQEKQNFGNFIIYLRKMKEVFKTAFIAWNINNFLLQSLLLKYYYNILLAKA